MSDITHSRKAEEWLLDPGDTTEFSAIATVHALLAGPRALREIDTTLRMGLDKIATLIKGPPPVPMLRLISPGGDPIYFNSRNLVSVAADPDNDQQTIVEATDGGPWVVDGTVADISAQIFQVVGAW